VEGASTHINGSEHTFGRVYDDHNIESAEWTIVSSCSIGVVEGSGVFDGGDGGVFENLGLTTEIIHNLFAGQRCGNVQGLECLRIGKSREFGCGWNIRATEIPPADKRCYMGSRNPQEKDRFEGPCEQSVEYSRGVRAVAFISQVMLVKTHEAHHPRPPAKVERNRV
jgi:hypothetical protein